MVLMLEYIMSQNDKKHFKNLVALAALQIIPLHQELS